MKLRAGRLIAAKDKAKREGWAKWIRCEADERAILVGYRFSQKRADHVLQWGPKYLRHTGDAEWYGKPFVPTDWQANDLLAPLFGWIHDSEEYGRTVRRFRKAYCQIPKKNGKSPTGAYVSTYMLGGDGPNVRACQGYSASTDKEQASIVWGNAADMVEASPKLQKRFKINRTTKTISRPGHNSRYRVLSSCPRRNEGWNANFIICDELHKWLGRELWDALKWAFATRPEPLLFAITTSGDDTETVCYEQYQYAKEVANGKRHDLQFFPLIYEADPTDDPADPETWRKANPSLGPIIKISTFQQDHDEATATLGQYEAFKQLRLNLWRQTAEAWIDSNKWDAGPERRRKAKGKRVDCYEEYTAEELHGLECWGGLDLALTTDLSAFVLVFPDDEAEDIDAAVFRTLAHFWLPEATAHHFADKVRYRDWQEAGWLTLTEGSEVNFDEIRVGIAQLAEDYRLQQLIYDPTFAGYLTQRLELEHGIERVEFPQRIGTYAEPCALFERLVLNGRMRHNGNDLLSWCIGNTKVKTDAHGRMQPVKPKRGDAKRIDGTVATIFGLGGAMRGENGRPTYYDEHDVESI